MSSIATVICAVMLVVAGVLHGQETWSIRSSGTSSGLWGATYGDGQFVVVGERGTLLTSTDGQTWVKRNSGTEAWLLAAEYVAGQFIVVGDASTVLVSRDAAVWRKIEIVADRSVPRWPFQPRRLNAIAAADFRWHGELASLGSVNAVGEDGVVVWGHPIDVKWAGITNAGAGWIRGIAYGKGREVRVGRDGILLTPIYSSDLAQVGQHHIAAAQVPQIGANLEAIVFAQDQFVAVGQSGAIFVSANATTWTERPRFSASHLFGIGYFNADFVAVGGGGVIFRSNDTINWFHASSPTTRALRAVAISENTIVAVGDAGTIVNSTPAPKKINITEQPVAAATNVGGAAAFRVMVSGSPPTTYQWFHEGRPIAAGTTATLALSPVTAADAGSYQVRAQNATGSIVSSTALLTVVPAPSTPIVDPGFHADASLRGVPKVILPLADGRVVIGMSNPMIGEGTIDSFASEVLRLLADGGIDPTFRRGSVAVEEFAWRPTFYLPTINQLLPQPDERIIVTGYFGTYDGTTAPGMVRLEKNGQVDTSFRPAIATPPKPRQDGDFTAYAPTAALQPDGKIVYINLQGALQRLQSTGDRDPDFFVDFRTLGNVARAVAVDNTARIFVGSGSVRTSGSGKVTALLSDGRLDPGFVPYSCDPVDELHPTRDGGVIVVTRYDAGPIFPSTPPRPRFPTKTFRLRSNGSLDPALPVRDIALAAPPAPDGSLLFTGGKFVAPDGTTETTPNFGVGFDFHVRVQRFGPDGRLWFGGDFSSYNGVDSPTIARLNIVSTENLSPPRLVDAWAGRSAVRLGESVRLYAAAVAPGPVTYTWLSDPGTFTAGGVTSEPWYDVTPTWGADIWQYTVRVSNSAGSVTSARFPVRVEPGDLRIMSQPRHVSLTLGKYADGLAIRLAPTNHPIREEWRRDGQIVDGPPGGSVQPSHAGAYTVTYTDLFGKTITSDPIVVTVADMSRFSNLSTRAMIGGGERAAILGFVIPEEASIVREVMLRGVGPKLAQFGVSGSLPAARLEVFRHDGALLARANRPDGSSTSSALQVGAFPLGPDEGDAAVVLTLRPGNYTARLSGIGGATGIGLIELYEADNRSERLQNISSRVFVGPGTAESAIAGFAVSGTASKRMLVRAAGPALAAFGVEGMLANPRLEIRDEFARLVAANDDWQSQNDASAVAASAASVGAFPFAPGSRDSAIVTSLPAGNYTALVSGSDGSPGVALVEIYELR